MIDFREQPMGPDDLDPIRRQLQRFADIHNRTPDPELGGLSPLEMRALLADPWNDPDSPVRLFDGLPLEELEEIRFFAATRRLIRAVAESDGVRATQTGAFNRRFVDAHLAAFFSPEDEAQVRAINKVINETDVFPLHVGRLVSEIAGLLQKRKGRIVAVKSRSAMLRDSHAGKLFTQLFKAFFTRFNLAYLAHAGDGQEWLQMCAGAVLFALRQRAVDWVSISGVAEEVLPQRVFSRLQMDLRDVRYRTPDQIVEMRLLRPMRWWGLVEFRYREEYKLQIPDAVRVTPFVDRLLPNARRD